MTRPRLVEIWVATSIAATGIGLQGCSRSAETARATRDDQMATTADASQSAFRAVLVGERTVSTEVGEAFPFVDPSGTAQTIGAPINTEHSQPDLLVAADGSMMIIVITDHPTGLGSDDLYVSHWRNGSWTEPHNLGPVVNTAEYEYGPSLSPDSRFLGFTSHRTGNGDTYRIPIAELDLESWPGQYRRDRPPAIVRPRYVPSAVYRRHAFT